MPRPARTKGASGRLATRLAASTSESDSIPAPVPQVTKDPENPSSDIYGVSDRELKRRRSTRRSAAAAATTATTTTTAQQAGALEGAKRRRDEAMDRLGDITSTTATDAAGYTSEKAASPAIEVGRRERSVTATTTRRRIPDASGLDVPDDDEMFGDMDTSFDDQDLDSPPAAHNSTDTSSFNVALFKRGRPRTSSIVGRGDGPIRPSSRGPNTPSISSTLNLGIFKRRAREPSILGTARKQRARSQSVPSVAQSSAAQSEDEGAFAPEDAGTPLDRSRMRTSASAARSDVSSPAARSRKRKSTESHASSSKRRVAESEDDQNDDDVRDSIELSSPPPSDQIVEPQRTSAAPEIDDSIMAPPASSDSEADSPSMWPSLKSLGKGYRVRRAPSRTRKTPAPEDDASDISSPPSLTHSPDYAGDRRNPRAAKGRNASGRREPSPITTADLAAMLPRRNRRVRDNDDPWDLDSDSDAGHAAPANDDDELSYLDARRARQHQKKQTRPLGPSVASAGQAHSKTSRPARRKYGSARNFSDKENNEGEADESIEVTMSPLPDDTFDSPEDPDETTQAGLAEELVKAARKFKEVDKWELDFEEVTEVEVSSPANAR